MKKEIVIEGMTCGHCKARVEKALAALSGVESVEVQLETKKAVVTLANDLSDSVLIDAIDEAGYDVISIE